MFRALITCIELLKEPKNVLGYMNVILLQSNQLHVPADHVVVLRFMGTGTQISVLLFSSP
jgi:hypothetical protein